MCSATKGEQRATLGTILIVQKERKERRRRLDRTTLAMEHFQKWGDRLGPCHSKFVDGNLLQTELHLGKLKEKTAREEGLKEAQKESDLFIVYSFVNCLNSFFLTEVA